MAMEVDSVSLRMKQRITSIPEMQNLSKEVGQLTKVRITLIQKEPRLGFIHLRHMTFFLPGSHLTMVNSKGKLLPDVASLFIMIFASVQVAVLQMVS